MASGLGSLMAGSEIIAEDGSVYGKVNDFGNKIIINGTEYDVTATALMNQDRKFTATSYDRLPVSIVVPNANTPPELIYTDPNGSGIIKVGDLLALGEDNYATYNDNILKAQRSKDQGIPLTVPLLSQQIPSTPQLTTQIPSTPEKEESKSNTGLIILIVLLAVLLVAVLVGGGVYFMRRKSNIDGGNIRHI